jgi:hypothetical protein
MEIYKLYQRMVVLKEQASFGADWELADNEVPFCWILSELRQCEDGIELVFSEDGEITISEAMKSLEPVVVLMPSAIVYMEYSGVKYPLKRIYENEPVFILECDIPYEDE